MLLKEFARNRNKVSIWRMDLMYPCALKNYNSISLNFYLQKSEAFQSVHHVTFILCYNVLSDFFALVFSFIRVCKHWWDDITQGKQ